MPLFDDTVRTDSRRPKRTESLFRFLNRIEGDQYSRVRALMEDWFDRFPAGGQTDVRERFRDDEPGQSIGAFWELYLHEIHLRLGYTLERDPEVPGTTKRPDFRASRGTSAFYLEGTLVSYPDAEMAARRRRDGVVDLVDEAFDPDFWVAIHIKVAGQTTPAKRDIVPAVEAWLGSLEWATVQAQFEQDPLQMPERDFQARDWLFSLRAYPRTPNVKGDAAFPTVNMGPRSGGAVDERGPIEADLRKKSTKYGRPDLPFVIAALCLRDFVTDSAIEQALYGPEVLKVPIRRGVGEIADAHVARNPRALWQWGEDRRATRVSAVLTAKHVNPLLIANSELTLWKNPWAAKPLADDLPWRTVTGDLTRNRLVVAEPTTQPREVLGISETWPVTP